MAAVVEQHDHVELPVPFGQQEEVAVHAEAEELAVEAVEDDRVTSSEAVHTAHPRLLILLPVVGEKKQLEEALGVPKGEEDEPLVAAVQLEVLEAVQPVKAAQCTCRGRTRHRPAHREWEEELVVAVVLLEVHPSILWGAVVAVEAAQHGEEMEAKVEVLKV